MFPQPVHLMGCCCPCWCRNNHLSNVIIVSVRRIFLPLAELDVIVSEEQPFFMKSRYPCSLQSFSVVLENYLWNLRQVSFFDIVLQHSNVRRPIYNPFLSSVKENPRSLHAAKSKLKPLTVMVGCSCAFLLCTRQYFCRWWATHISVQVCFPGNVGVGCAGCVEEEHWQSRF